MGDPLSVSSGIAGLLGLADAVFSRTYQCYQYAKGVNHAEKDIKELASGIMSLCQLLHGLSLVLNELEKETSERNFRLHHINSCRNTLRKIEKKLEDHDPTTGTGKVEKAVRKLKWPFSTKDTKELIDEVERHKATINIALSADSLTAILKSLSRQDMIADDVRELKNELRSRWAMETHIALGKQRREVLDFFGKIDPTSNHIASLRLRHPLTGLWVTDGDVFRTWLHTRNSKLWLSGIPGAGKTVLAASLIDETMNESGPNRAVAYFYCDYKDIEKQNPVNILGSLATQIARLNENAFALLQELFQSCHPEDRPSVQPDLSVLCRLLAKMLACFQDASIIVDGLDECGEHTPIVVESLAGLATVDESNTRILLLSRDIHEIRGYLEQDYVHLEIAAHSEDLRLYVEAEVEARQRKFGKGQLRIRNPELKDHIKATLVGRAQGMFRWVACQLDYLCELPTDAEKRAALSALPPTLNKTYERILESVNQHSPGVRKMVQLTLQWIVNSVTPLSLDALCEATSIKEGDNALNREAIYDEDTILSHCSSLVRRSAEDDHIELAHFTVQEFLASIEPDSPFAQYSQQNGADYSLLAKLCLTYIVLSDFEDVLVEDFQEWEEQQLQYPFRTHAVRHWAEYARQVLEDNDVVALTHRLFNPSKTICFLSWTRDYIYLVDRDWSDILLGNEEAFDVATNLFCRGDVAPLHLAASMGFFQLCQWLISSGCYINQSSSVGTPLHCALEGIYAMSIGLSWALSDSQSPRQSIKYSFSAERIQICQLLINNGADPSASYQDHFREDYRRSILRVYMHPAPNCLVRY